MKKVAQKPIDVAITEPWKSEWHFYFFKIEKETC